MCICATVVGTMIIDNLKAIQTKYGVSDAQFAKKLGIHRVSWQRIKNRRRKFGLKFIMRVWRVYPELKNEIDFFLSSRLTDVNNYESFATGTTVYPDADETPSNQNIRGIRGWLVTFIGKVKNIRF